MKYYGLKMKKRHDDFTYWYAKTKARAKSYFPGKHRNHYKTNYQNIFEDDYSFHNFNNGVPEGHWIKLEQIVTSDLVYREDIGKLQKGIRNLLKQHRSGDRFFGLPVDGLDEICKRIDRMDSVLLSGYDSCKCGIFDFRGESLESSIDYFTLQVKNINSSYLSVEFGVFLTKAKMNELQTIINKDYHDHRGYAYKTLSSKKNGGAYSSYTVVHYNDELLKANYISEWLSCIEWEFYNALKKYFPFMLHSQGIIPPRIEVFYTDMDFKDDNRFFWNSIGIADYQGQFIDERQKVFFDHAELRKDEDTCPRLLYIIKDDGIDVGQLKSVKDKVYYHIELYAREYFRFFFLRLLSSTSGKKIIKYKNSLGRIKLKKNQLRNVLKLRYAFERDIDPYIRYSRDALWEKSVDILRKEIYSERDEMLPQKNQPFYISYNDFCNSALSGAKKIDETITVLRGEFDDKEQILQHLSDYKNSWKSWWLNIVMLVIAAVTLFFVIFPNRAKWVADLIRCVVNWIIGFFR